MTPTRTRRLSTVIAGCVAMAASLTALAAIVVSDIAEARPSQDMAMIDDEVAPAPPVKVTKVAVQPEGPSIEDMLMLEPPDMPMPPKGKGKRRVNYGSFEGY
ncbi:MAG: hypothetical protein QM817_29150 [Archangium sp.]